MNHFRSGRTFLQNITSAAQANFLPAMGLQSIALLLLASYYYWPAAHQVLEQFAAWKKETGYLFAALSSAFAGAVLPLILQNWQRGDHRRLATRALPALLLFWALRGCVVDVFYCAQMLLWGDNARPLTLALKVLCDLTLFTPLFGVPSLVFLFFWLDQESSGLPFRHQFGAGWPAWWQREVWPLVQMAWVVWLPALLVIYALPVGLQFPTSAVIQCFWTLVLVVLTDKKQMAAGTT